MVSRESVIRAFGEAERTKIIQPGASEVEIIQNAYSILECGMDADSLTPDQYEEAIDILIELNNKSMEAEKYYQPTGYTDDGTNIEHGGLPVELHSWEVFRSKESCEEWLQENGYDPQDYVINEYSGDDIEEYRFVD